MSLLALTVTAQVAAHNCAIADRVPDALAPARVVSQAPVGDRDQTASRVAKPPGCARPVPASGPDLTCLGGPAVWDP